MYIYDKYKLAFHHNAKCGGISMIDILRDALGLADVHFGSHYLHQYARVIHPVPYRKYKEHPHAPLFVKFDLMDKLGIDYSELDIIAVVRNPFERLVSFWNFSKLAEGNPAKRMDCNAFVHYLIEANSPWIQGLSRQMLVNEEIPENVVIFKLEELDQTLPPFIKARTGQSIEMCRKNVHPHDTWQSILSQKSIDLIRKEERVIFEKFYPDI